MAHSRASVIRMINLVDSLVGRMGTNLLFIDRQGERFCIYGDEYERTSVRVLPCRVVCNHNRNIVNFVSIFNGI